MTLNLKLAHLLVATAFIVCAPVMAQAELPKNSSTSNFSLPKTTDGERDMLILGKQATTLGDLISIEGVRITLYPLKKRNSHIELFTPKTSYSKELEKASSSERVNVRIFPKPKAAPTKGEKRQNYNTVLDGVGFDLDCSKQTFRIRSKVNVRIFPADTEATTQSVTITAKELFYDVINHLIEFKGDVHVVSSGGAVTETFKLNGDSLSIFTDKHGTPSTMTATGHVVLTMDKDIATADKAVYRKMTAGPAGTWPNLGETLVHQSYHRFILSGNPTVEMGSQSMTGADKVIIDRCKGDQQIRTTGGKPEIILKPSEKIPALLPPLKGPTLSPEDAASGKTP